jgi:hypothetical protein
MTAPGATCKLLQLRPECLQHLNADVNNIRKWLQSTVKYQHQKQFLGLSEIIKKHRVLVAHSCNPSYLGG